MKYVLALAASCAGLGCLGATAAAQPKSVANLQAEMIAPFVDEQTIGVVHVDLSQVDFDRLLEQMEALAPAAHELPAGLLALRSLAEQLIHLGVEDLYAATSLLDLPRPPFLVIPLVPGTDAAGLQKLFGGNRFEAVEPVGESLFVGNKRTLERIKSRRAADRPEIGRAFAAAGDSAVQFLLLPTSDHRRVIEELLPILPPEAGGGPSKVLTRGAMWIAISADWKPHSVVNVAIQSQDREAAMAFRAKWLAMAQFFSHDARVIQAVPQLKELADQFVPTVKGDRLLLSLDAERFAREGLIQLVNAGLQAALAPVRKERTVNHLKQIGLAMHNYHDVYGSFPAAANYGTDGKPLLSWRVRVLPFIGHAPLYQQFRLDEPWDSDHNRKLIDRMPEVYRSENWSREAPNKTCFVVVTSAGSVAESRKKPAPGDKQDAPEPATSFQGGEGVSIADVTDGTSNTILAVEADAGHAVIWTKPDDLPYDAEQPTKGFSVDAQGLVPILFCDGSVQFLKLAPDAEAWRRLLLRNDGEVISRN